MRKSKHLILGHAKCPCNKKVMKRKEKVRGENKKKREKEQAKHSGARVLSLIWENALAAEAAAAATTSILF